MQITYPGCIQLRDVWSSEIDKDPAASTKGIHLNVMPWLSRMTLDVIGLAGELSMVRN